MRIVTYNFLRAGSLKRCGHWSRVIRSLKPDLLLAQECRPPQGSPGERFRHGQRDGFAWQSAGTRDWGSGLFARSASLVPIAIPDYNGWVVGRQPIRIVRWRKRCDGWVTRRRPVAAPAFSSRVHGCRVWFAAVSFAARAGMS